MSNHKFLTDAPVHDDEAGYTIEDGVVVESTERPNARKAYDEWTRFWPKTSADYRAEEAEWAARSGPCVTLRKASATSSNRRG
jgi:hypothetical protein